MYLSYTNASAFSPTDTMPLTRWAKLLMLIQSAVSILTLILVAARAVNILGWHGPICRAAKRPGWSARRQMRWLDPRFKAPIEFADGVPALLRVRVASLRDRSGPARGGTLVPWVFGAAPRLGILVGCPTQKGALRPESGQRPLRTMIRPARRPRSRAGTSGRRACCRPVNGVAA
jgi:hypothetical protein